MRYIKKPVVIEAWPVSDIIKNAESNWKGLPESVRNAYERGEFVFTSEAVHVKTLEGVHITHEGDMLIKGVRGEFYGCKPDIFEATYDLFEPSMATTETN